MPVRRVVQPPRQPAKATAKSEAILVRLSKDEHRILSAAAASAGLGLGPWLRYLGMREARVPPTAAGERVP